MSRKHVQLAIAAWLFSPAALHAESFIDTILAANRETALRI